MICWQTQLFDTFNGDAAAKPQHEPPRCLARWMLGQPAGSRTAGPPT
jgi:hypothetical protein